MPLTRLLADLLLNTTLADSEVHRLRFVSGAHSVEVDRLVLRGASAQFGATPGPRFEAREAELSGVTLAGPLQMPAPLAPLAKAHAAHAAGAGAASTAPPATAAGTAPDPWRLEPLASAEGMLRAKIEDAQFLFDADATIPVSRGQVDFNRATVEHVGPDSHMGVSRLGVFVEAPNGRTYLYQFDAAPLAGVTLEQRGSLFGGLGGLGGDRGGLTLQPFVESLLRQSVLGLTRGVTEQARALLGRTAVEGELRLGDGRLQMPGVQTELKAQRPQENVVHMRAEALGRGLTLEVPALSALGTAAGGHGMRVSCERATGRLALQLERSAATFSLRFETLLLAGVTLSAGPAPSEQEREPVRR